MDSDENNLPFGRNLELLEDIRVFVESVPLIEFLKLDADYFAAWARLLVFTNLRFLPGLIVQDFPYSVSQLEKIESTLQSGNLDSPEVVNAIMEVAEIDLAAEQMEDTPNEIKDVIFNLSTWITWLLEESKSGSLARVFFLNGAFDGGLMSYWTSSLYAKLGIIGRTPRHEHDVQETLASDYDATFRLWQSEHNKYVHLIEDLPKKLFRADISNFASILETMSSQELDALLESDYIINFTICDEIFEILSSYLDNLSNPELKTKWDGMIKKPEVNTFEDRLGVVASAYFSRFDDDVEADVLVKIFEQHDMSGVIALAALAGDIEIKSDQAREWIENTYEVLNTIFSFPEGENAENQVFKFPGHEDNS